jgi:uncharacterized protein (UPF0335 family)
MTNYGGVSGEKLRQLVSKIERLEEEKKTVQEALADTYGEAKSSGFDVKVLRKLISLRKKDAQKLAEEEEVLDLYKHALGMTGNFEAVEEKEAA